MSGGPFASSAYSTPLMQAGDTLLKLAGDLVNLRLFRSKARAIDVQVAAVKFHNLAGQAERAHGRLRGSILQFMLQHPDILREAHELLSKQEKFR